MIVSGYSMHLYCDSEVAQPYDVQGHNSSDPAVFAGPNHASCAKQARAAGWVLIGQRFAICPVCAKLRTPELRVRLADLRNEVRGG